MTVGKLPAQPLIQLLESVRPFWRSPATTGTQTIRNVRRVLKTQSRSKDRAWYYPKTSASSFGSGCDSEVVATRVARRRALLLKNFLESSPGIHKIVADRS